MNLLIAIIVAAVVLWLLGYILPGFLAALIALLVFLALAFGGFGYGGDRWTGRRFGTGARY